MKKPFKPSLIPALLTDIMWPWVGVVLLKHDRPPKSLVPGEVRFRQDIRPALSEGGRYISD